MEYMLILLGRYLARTAAQQRPSRRLRRDDQSDHPHAKPPPSHLSRNNAGTTQQARSA